MIIFNWVMTLIELGLSVFAGTQRMIASFIAGNTALRNDLERSPKVNLGVLYEKNSLFHILGNIFDDPSGSVTLTGLNLLVSELRHSQHVHRSFIGGFCYEAVPRSNIG